MHICCIFVDIAWRYALLIFSATLWWYLLIFVDICLYLLNNALYALLIFVDIWRYGSCCSYLHWRFLCQWPRYLRGFTAPHNGSCLFIPHWYACEHGLHVDRHGQTPADMRWALLDIPAEICNLILYMHEPCATSSTSGNIPWSCLGEPCAYRIRPIFADICSYPWSVCAPWASRGHVAWIWFIDTRARMA